LEKNMLEFESVERIAKPVRFPCLRVGDVFTWGAKYDAWVKVNRESAFCLTTPSSGLSIIDKEMELVECEAKLLVTGLSTKYKPNSGDI
jgi:hypothetical protein